MPVAEDKPAVDAILLKVMESVPFQLTTDGGVEEARQRFRDLPRAEVHPEVRSEDRVIDGPVELDNARTLVHGYAGYDGVVPAATEAVERGMNALRAALHSP